MIGVIVLNLLFAVNLMLRQIILDCTQPIFFQGCRLTGAGILLLGYLYFYHRQLLRFQRRDIMLFFQASLFFSYLSYLLAGISLVELSSARFAFMYNLAPFITAIICFFYLHEKLNRKAIASLIIGFVGFLPLVFAGEQGDIDSASLFSIPGLQLFISIIAYAYGWVIVSQLVRKRNYSPLLVTGISFFCGGIAILLTSLVFENWLTVAPVSDIFRFTTYLIAIIFIGEVIAVNMYAALLKRYSATFLSFAEFLYPLFSAFLGWLFLHEKITYNFFISAIIVMFALYLFNQSEKDKKKALVSS